LHRINMPSLHSFSSDEDGSPQPWVKQLLAP
jgi:hypothetical protein